MICRSRTSRTSRTINIVSRQEDFGIPVRLIRNVKCGVSVKCPTAPSPCDTDLEAPSVAQRIPPAGATVSGDVIEFILGVVFTRPVKGFVVTPGVDNQTPNLKAFLSVDGGPPASLGGLWSPGVTPDQFQTAIGYSAGGPICFGGGSGIVSIEIGGNPDYPLVDECGNVFIPDAYTFNVTCAP